MSQALRRKFNIVEYGEGTLPLVFLHGLGWNQAVWRFVAPHFGKKYRVLLVDLMGSGGSDASQWNAQRYATLDGHADDLVEIVETLGLRNAVLVVHSVSAMIGLLAELKAPHAFAAHAMIAPSPCYYNLPGYQGGFSPESVEAMLELVELDPLELPRSLGTAVLGSARAPQFQQEFEASVAACHPDAFRQMAQVTFRGDYRERLAELVKPVLVAQCMNDVIAPMFVGKYMQDQLPDCLLEILPTEGHVPQLVDPTRCIVALEHFIPGLGLGSTRDSGHGALA